MPTTPYAKLLLSINAGPTQDGGVTASPGDTVQMSAESTAQWDLTTPPRWEIYAYPPGWTGPAAGWTTESVPQPGGGNADVYVYLGLGPPPSFTLPALPMWGKFLMKLTVQGGLLAGRASEQLVDNTTAVQTIGPNGLYDVAVGEEGQFDTARSWVGGWQDDLRLLDAALVGSASPYAALPTAIAIGAGAIGGVNQYSQGDHEHPVTVGVPGTITIGAAAAAGGGTALAGAAHVHALPAPVAVSAVSAAAGSLGVSTAVAREDHAHQVSVGTPVNVGTANSAGASNNLSRADHVHALSFATVNSILGGATAAITVNGQTLTSGGFIGPYFSTDSANPAASGLLRAANNTSAVAFRNAANSADIDAVAIDASDIFTYGATGAAGVTVQTGAASLISLKVNTASIFVAGPTVATFYTSSTDDAGGNGVIQIYNATTEPTNASSGSAHVWTYGGALKCQSDLKIKNTIVPALTAGAGTEDLRSCDRRATRTQTTDATQTTTLTFAVPDNSVVFIRAIVIAWTVDGGSSAGYELKAVVKRFAAGAATLVGAVDVFTREDAAGLDATLDVNTNDARIRVTGIALTTFEWFSTIEATLMTPA